VQTKKIKADMLKNNAAMGFLSIVKIKQRLDK
jgi:hypothetical protein